MRSILAFAAVLGFSSIAMAQGGQNPLSYEAVAKSKNGQWAEYTMSMKGQAQTIKMKYAIVEKTDKTLALEVDSQTPMGPVLMHMAFEPVGVDAWKLTKARMQMGTSVQDMPPAALAQGGIKKNDAPGKLIGTEEVKTAVGSFSCKHYQKVAPKEAGGSTIDMWMNDKVLPTGLVKMADSRGAEAVLSAVGTDAKAKLSATGAPTPAPGAAAAPAPASSAPASAPSGASSAPKSDAKPAKK
jgi:hypothetical protein